MRDRDSSGRPRNARPRDELGRPLPTGCHGVEPLRDIDTSADAVVALAGHLLDQGCRSQAHEALETVWKVAIGTGAHCVEGYGAIGCSADPRHARQCHRRCASA